MANGRISRLSAISDILKEDGKRRLSNARRESKISMTDLEARNTDVEVRTIEGNYTVSLISLYLAFSCLVELSKISIARILRSVLFTTECEKIN